MQYISDNEGKITGVFIPIEEWNSLKEKFKDFFKSNDNQVPDWQISEVRSRMAEYKKDPKSHFLDFDSAIEEIEKEL